MNQTCSVCGDAPVVDEFRFGEYLVAVCENHWQEYEDGDRRPDWLRADGQVISDLRKHP